MPLMTKRVTLPPVHETSGINVNAPKPVMDIPSGAQYLSIGVRTLRELIARGEIRSVRIGRRRLIRLKDCEAFLDDHTV